jgi:beta-galactosidase
VEVFVGHDSYGRLKPDRENFPNLPHPPFQMPGLNLWITWGGRLPDLCLVGYIGGEAVAEQWIAADGVPHALVLQPDDAELKADGADMTRLVFKIVDKYGNRLPYATQVVSFELDGPAELIGENPFALVGGQAALYVKARHERGAVTIRAQSPCLADATAIIQMV